MSEIIYILSRQRIKRSMHTRYSMSAVAGTV
nr:MAG TPA: hypothetical protein [Caudoviricetes sp.]